MGSTTPLEPPRLQLVTSPRTSPHAARDSTRYFPHTIDLLRGHPSTLLLPTSDIYAAASIALHTPALLPSDSYRFSRHPLHYGPDMGNLNLRYEIGRWLSNRYGLLHEIAPERICLTNGASYGLMYALLHLTSPGTGYTKQAFLISPTYFLAARVFEDAGFTDKMTAISSTNDHTSIDFEALEAHLNDLEAAPSVPLEEGQRPFLRDGRPSSTKRLFRYVLFCVPTYSNPTGETWDLPTRRRLVTLARKYDMLVISDDVYDFLANTGDTSALDGAGKLLPRLVTIERDLLNRQKTRAEGETGVCLSNCSFSKLLGPGLRVGWMEGATEKLVLQVAEGGANHSGGSPGHFASTVILPLLLSHSPQRPDRKIDHIVQRLTEAYTQNSIGAKEAIKTYLPAGTQVLGGKGGFFIWIVLPEDINAEEVVRIAAEKEGVVLMSGRMAECPGRGEAKLFGWGARAIRISVSYCVEEEIEEGIKRLGRAVERWRDLRREVVWQEGEEKNSETMN